MRHQFEGFALIPENLGGFRHRRIRQRRHHISLLDRHGPRWRDYVFVLVAENHTPNLRFEIGFVLHELLLQMFSGKFQGDELVMVVRATRCRQPLVPYRVIARITRHIVALPSSNCTDRAVTLQVQTKLEAARMKTAAPIEQTLRAKVMPFNRNPELINIAVKRAPSIFNFWPAFTPAAHSEIISPNYNG